MDVTAVQKLDWRVRSAKFLTPCFLELFVNRPLLTSWQLARTGQQAKRLGPTYMGLTRRVCKLLREGATCKRPGRGKYNYKRVSSRHPRSCSEITAAAGGQNLGPTGQRVAELQDCTKEYFQRHSYLLLVKLTVSVLRHKNYSFAGWTSNPTPNCRGR